MSSSGGRFRNIMGSGRQLKDMAARAISAKVNTLLNADKNGTLQSTNEETQPTTDASKSTSVGESAPSNSKEVK